MSEPQEATSKSKSKSKSKSTGRKKRGGKRKVGEREREREIICEIPWSHIPPVENPLPLPAWFTEEVAKKPESEKISTCPVCSGKGTYSNLKEWCHSCIGIRCGHITGLEVFGDPLGRTMPFAPVYPSDESSDAEVDCTPVCKPNWGIEPNPDIWRGLPDYTVGVYSSDESSIGSSGTEVDCRDQVAKIISKEPECFERGVRLDEVCCFPELKWAQRVDKVYVTVLLPDAKNPKVNLDPDGKFTFSATAGAENHLYKLKLDLFDKVNVEESKINLGVSRIFCVIEKAEKVWWKKLLCGDEKTPHYIKVDWDKWVDKDEDDGQVNLDWGGMDFSNFGGMSGMSGMDDADDLDDSDDEGKEVEKPAGQEAAKVENKVPDLKQK